MRFRTTLLPLLAAALVGGCSATAVGSANPSAQAPTPPPSTTGGPIMPHGTWVSTEVSGHTLVPGTKVTLTFDGVHLSVNAGCNSMSGTLTTTQGTFDITQMMTTEMGCSPDLTAQDQWLGKFLQGASFGAGSTLTLTNGDVTMTLVDRQTTNLPLVGTRWTLNGIVKADAVSTVPQGVTATLVFQDGKVLVDTGCNTGSGTATSTDTTITFGAIALTKLACTTWAGAVEQQMLAVLRGEQPYSIDGDTLSIGGGGTDGLVLKGANPPASTGGPTMPTPS